MSDPTQHSPLGAAVPITWAPPAPPPRSAAPLVIWAVGMVIAVTGTFLPWLYSGRVAKNSYQLVGVGQRRLAVPAWVDVLLTAWPYLGPVWAIAAVLVLLRQRVAGLGLSALAALASGAVGASIVAVSGRFPSGSLSVCLVGPVTTVVGSLLVLGAAGLLILRRGRVTPPTVTPIGSYRAGP